VATGLQTKASHLWKIILTENYGEGLWQKIEKAHLITKLLRLSIQREEKLGKVHTPFWRNIIREKLN
jgi:hypothetical protein